MATYKIIWYGKDLRKNEVMVKANTENIARAKAWRMLGGERYALKRVPSFTLSGEMVAACGVVLFGLLVAFCLGM